MNPHKKKNKKQKRSEESNTCGNKTRLKGHMVIMGMSETAADRAPRTDLKKMKRTASAKVECRRGLCNQKRHR